MLQTDRDGEWQSGVGASDAHGSKARVKTSQGLPGPDSAGTIATCCATARRPMSRGVGEWHCGIIEPTKAIYCPATSVRDFHYGAYILHFARPDGDRPSRNCTVIIYRSVSRHDG